MLEEIPAEVALAEAAPEDTVLPVAPADTAPTGEESQGALSPAPMSPGGSGDEALRVGRLSWANLSRLILTVPTRSVASA